MSIRGRAALVAAVIALLGALAAWAGLHSQGGVEKQLALDGAESASLRVEDALAATKASLAAAVQNAAANPRLVAALEAGVDAETLTDLLDNEAWWDTFRRAYAWQSVAREGSPLDDAQVAGLDPSLRGLIADARVARKPRTKIAALKNQAFVLIAAPITLTTRGDVPVLVAARTLDLELVAALAERAGGAVGVSDGTRLLVAAGAAAPIGALKSALGHSGVTSVVEGDAGPAVIVMPLEGGLSLLVEGHVAPEAVQAITSRRRTTAAGLLAAGLALAVVAFFRLSRGGGIVASPATEHTVASPPPDQAAFELALRGEPPLDAPPQARATPAAPEGFSGGYHLVERLGQGGMADVYSAVALGEGGFRRPLVIKRLRPELSVDTASVAQFCDEATLLAGLNHPSVVSVIDFGRAGEHYFLAEEYIFGRTLAALTERSMSMDRLPLPVSVIASVACDTLEALQYVHSKRNEDGQDLKMVHRDVSPDNIMVSREGKVKLLDFGVAKAATGRTTKTEIGVVKGNVVFMSPEQARGLSVDSRADLFSLGLVICFCMRGKPLYDAETSYGLLMRAGHGPGDEDWRIIDTFPAPLPTILRRAMAPRLDDRYGSADEFAADLRIIGRSVPPQAARLMARYFAEEFDQEARRLEAFVPSGTSGFPRAATEGRR